MKYGLTIQEGNIVTRSGAASGNAGKALAIIVGDGNAAGNSAGGALSFKAGNGSGTGVGGSITLQPGLSATGTDGSVGILPYDSLAGSTSELRFFGINSTNYVGFKAADTVTNTTWTLPTADGGANTVLQTNGAGVLSWAALTVPNVFVNVTGNTGTATTDIAADTLAITGSVGITTTASDSGTDTLSLSLTRTGITAKATPLAADQFMMFNSASSNDPSYSTATQVITALNLVTATANGVLVRTAANTYASRTLTASATAAQQGVVITNGDGVSSNPTIGLNINGLSAGVVGASTTIPAYDGTNNTKITPTAIVSARIVRGTFLNAGLTAGSIAITHSLSVSGVLVQVYDENNQLVQPDNITLTSTTVVTVELTSFGTIAGTWSYVIFG